MKKKKMVKKKQKISPKEEKEGKKFKVPKEQKVQKIKLSKGKVKINKGTLKLTDRKEIAFDFATKSSEKFGKVIKSIVLFGSTAKGVAAKNSDIDLVIIVDDCSILWDAELTAWYREELGKLIKENPYKKALHINTVRLSTWWEEMTRGEPAVVNIIRFGESLIDFGGFFNPLKVLLSKGKIKNTPEMIYIALNRAPSHMLKSKAAMLNAIEGLYWAFVDAAHSALMAAKKVPPSPEHITHMLKEEFVRSKMLKDHFTAWYNEIYTLTHKILRTEITDIKGAELDKWRSRADIFLREMARIVERLTRK